MVDKDYKKIVDALNIIELKPKIIPIIIDNTKLMDGLKFTIDNLKDYESDTFVSDLINNFFDNLNAFIKRKKPEFFDELNDVGYSGNKFVGSRYKQVNNLSVRDIAKLVREEIKILYPDLKISTTSDYNSIRVEIKDINFNPFSKEYQEFLESNKPYSEWNNTDYRIGRYNEEYKKLEDKLKAVMSQYNFDDSDSMTDYFHKNFYASVTIDELAIKLKFYPNHIESLKSKQWSDEYEIKAKERNAKAQERKGKYKKGQEVIYIYDREKSNIPVGEYNAIILKAPNGRAVFSTYDIRFFVDKGFDKDGNVITLEKPRVYIATVYDETKLKSIE